MIKAGVGSSKNKDSYQAGYEACRMAMDKAGEDKPDLVVAFASVSFDQSELLRGIREASNKAPLVGCTDAGEITNEGSATKSVGVMVIKADKIKFTTGLGKDVKAGAREAGKAVAKEVEEKTP